MPGGLTTQVADAELDEAAGELRISWADGHSSAYPLQLLRAECPCAGCRQDREDARSNPLHVVAAASPRAAELKDVEPIGNYALRPTWGDGHQAGLFTFEFLREICPCQACSADRAAEPLPWVHGIYIPR